MEYVVREYNVAGNSVDIDTFDDEVKAKALASRLQKNADAMGSDNCFDVVTYRK